MKHILLLFILNTFFVKHISAQNPNLEWAFGMGDSISCINNLTIGNKVLAANDGHIYITGLFCNTVDFDYSEKKFELKSNIEPSNYIAKYDTNGNFIWAKKIEGEVLISSIKVDLENNIYLSGDFQGFISFDSTLTKTPFYFGSNGYADAIAIKIDSKGQLVWAKTFGNKNYENIASSEIDASGSLYLFGNFADTVDFDPSPNIYNLHSVNERCDFFVVKLDKNGNFLWAKTIGGTGVDALCNTTSNKLNNIYLIGRFSDSISLKIANCNSTIYTQPSDTNINAHFSNLFILKMDTAGNFAWIKQTLNSISPYPKIVVDSYGDLYIGDNFTNTITFDTDADKQTLNSTNKNDPTGYITKWDSEGTPLWPIQMNGRGKCEINAIKTDKYEDVLISGFYTDTLNYNAQDSTQRFIYSKNGNDAFIIKYSKKGEFIWAINNGNNGNSAAIDMSVDMNNNFYISGFFSDTIDFNPSPDTN